jgi:hypothetical protein
MVKLLLAVSVLSACYDNPPPQIPRPQPPAVIDGATLDVESRVVTERRPVTKRDHVCVRTNGHSSCSDVSVTSREPVRVTHATATYGGAPLTVHEALGLADPTYVPDWTRMDKLAANCRHASVPKYVGGILTLAGMLLVIQGTGTSDGSVNMPYAIGGGAALAGGLAAYALGKYALGGQDCAEANEIYQRHRAQYSAAGDTDVEDDLASELDIVARRFNAHLGKGTPAPTTDAPAEETQ